jgi:hypothetical protein
MGGRDDASFTGFAGPHRNTWTLQERGCRAP